VGRRKLNSGDIWVLGGKPGSKGSGVPGPRIGYMPQVGILMILIPSEILFLLPLYSKLVLCHICHLLTDDCKLLVNPLTVLLQKHAFTLTTIKLT